jgi:predicted dehydrogenase
MLRIGIVGAGFAGRFHYKCLKRIHTVPVEVVGVMDRTGEVAERFAKQRGIRAFTDFDALLEHVDAISICSPPYAHEEQVIRAVPAGKDVIVEKPFTGYFGPEEDRDAFRAFGVPRRMMLSEALESLGRIAEAVRRSGIILGYAENFVYAPAIQKERELIARSGAQILRMIGEESHNGSESPVYGMWRYAGGGSLIGKGCHPLGALLYFKRVEGFARHGKPIRPVTVSARVHEVTRLANYQDRSCLAT